MVEKMCYQMVHPDAKTPCFEEAGNKPCSLPTCPVYDYINANGSLAHALGRIAFTEHVNDRALHYNCPISKFGLDDGGVDNEEYITRMKAK